MSTPDNRYHLCSSIGPVLVGTDRQRAFALERAARMQRNAEPGEEFLVFDSMARVGQPEKWGISHAGVPFVYAWRKAVA